MRSILVETCLMNSLLSDFGLKKRECKRVEVDSDLYKPVNGAAVN